MPEWPNIDRDGDGSSKPQNRDKQEDREEKHAVVAENKTKQGRRKKGQEVGRKQEEVMEVERQTDKKNEEEKLEKRYKKRQKQESIEEEKETKEEEEALHKSDGIRFPVLNLIVNVKPNKNKTYRSD